METHHFQCGHEECGSQFAMSNRDDLMGQVAQHLKDEHGIGSATETLMSYLEFDVCDGTAVLKCLWYW